MRDQSSHKDWKIGHAGSTSTFDLAFEDFRVVPEPSSGRALAVALLIFFIQPVKRLRPETSQGDQS